MLRFLMATTTLTASSNLMPGQLINDEIGWLGFDHVCGGEEEGDEDGV